MNTSKPHWILGTLLLGITLAISASSNVDPRIGRLAKLNSELEATEIQLRELGANYHALAERASQHPGRYLDAVNINEGRLTLESGVAVSTSDQANKTTLYFTPYHGSTIALFTGSVWQVFYFTEISLALSGLTGSTNYDVFARYDSGVTIELGGAWSSNTARAATSDLSLQDGIYVKSVSGVPDKTRRYLGTIRATSSTETQDTVGQRFVWNYQNQVTRPLRCIDTTNSWTYATASWRAANNDTNNRVEIVSGVSSVFVQLFTQAIITNASGELKYYAAGVGVDTSTSNSAYVYGSGSGNGIVNQTWGQYVGYPGLGYHALYWIEISNTSTITVRGDNSDGTKYQSGMIGMIRG